MSHKLEEIINNLEQCVNRHSDLSLSYNDFEALKSSANMVKINVSHAELDNEPRELYTKKLHEIIEHLNFKMVESQALRTKIRAIGDNIKSDYQKLTKKDKLLILKVLKFHEKQKTEFFQANKAYFPIDLLTVADTKNNKLNYFHSVFWCQDKADILNKLVSEPLQKNLNLTLSSMISYEFTDGDNKYQESAKEKRREEILRLARELHNLTVELNRKEEEARQKQIAKNQSQIKLAPIISDECEDSKEKISELDKMIKENVKALSFSLESSQITQENSQKQLTAKMLKEIKNSLKSLDLQNETFYQLLKEFDPFFSTDSGTSTENSSPTFSPKK